MPRLRLSSNPNSVHRVQLYKKQPAASKPCCIRDSAICAHLIHRPVHSLWGQLQKAQSPDPQGIESIGKTFLLDPGTPRMQTPQKGATVENPPDSQRPVITLPGAFFPEFNHRLIHRLVIISRRSLHPYKPVDKSAQRLRKSRWSKNNHPAGHLVNKGLQPTTPTLPTATSTANGDKSK